MQSLFAGTTTTRTSSRSAATESDDRITHPRKTEATVARDLSQELTIAVEDRIQSCSIYELRRLQCEVRTGILFIRGQVSSYYLKQRGQELFRTLSGIQRIVNELEVIHDASAWTKPTSIRENTQCRL